MRTLALIILIALAVVLLSPVALAGGPRSETGRATIFAREGDRWAGGASRCLGRRVLPTDAGIAHRTLPCGTRVLVANQRTGRSVVTVVLDAGPYGACVTPGWRRGPCPDWAVKRRRSDPGIWRGVADLTPPVAEALEHRSFDLVTLTVIAPAP